MLLLKIKYIPQNIPLNNTIGSNNHNINRNIDNINVSNKNINPIIISITLEIKPKILVTRLTAT